MAPQRPRAAALLRLLGAPFSLIVGCLTLMWLVELADTFLLGDRLQRNGIQPRQIRGLDGIAWAPWLHSGFGHLLSNSVPFVALGWLVSLRGRRYWLWVSLVTALLGGGLTWLLAGGNNHIGASGVVFGYFGALVGGAYYDRRPALLAPALVALLLYSGLLAGVVPQGEVSWEGHLFGLIAGVITARALAEPPAPPTDDDEGDGPYPWEADEPWLDSE